MGLAPTNSGFADRSVSYFTTWPCHYPIPFTRHFQLFTNLCQTNIEMSAGRQYRNVILDGLAVGKVFSMDGSLAAPMALFLSLGPALLCVPSPSRASREERGMKGIFPVA